MWMIDATALSVLGKFAPEVSPPAGLLHTSSVVMSEVKGRPGCARLFDSEDGQNALVTVHGILIDGPEQEWRAYQHLRGTSPQATANSGEHEAIALLATRDELRHAIYVVQDRHAVALALAELGPGRVVTPFDCWQALHLGAILTLEQRDLLFSRVEKNDPGLRRPLRYR